jgi:3-methylcrotonyl-CoA carboxylase alpha subunit
MFRKLLIANRGEIACRVIRTARRLGIATVAVYSDADDGALHVAMADEAVRLGPAPARESYLSIDAVIAAARSFGAEAIHPGYGFLSENAAFAEACAAAGIVFVGPPAAAIRAMGSKSEAKALMERAGVPLLPGYHGASPDAATLKREATRIGYPVMLKASAGGGGKGMRRVDREADFEASLAAAQREAKASFGDDLMLVEKYLERPRHIEMQVFADSHGNAVHLFERDCSIQRRHQKVLEEAPAPGMTLARRRTMGAAALAAARAVGYVGAGTVEFIAAQDGSFHFMEMNTRLQVEHPVTEMVTGLDLVEWQLRVAAGETLPLTQEQIALDGHAMEVRVYAEDPERGFLPATGTIAHLRAPDAGAQVRVDTGVRAGDTIGIHYDPMIAKLIVHGADRADAVRRLGAALDRYQVAGVATNLAFLRRLARHPAFAAAEIDTGFIERHGAALLGAAAAIDDRGLALAALGVLLRRADAAREAALRSADPTSPWHRVDGWRLNGSGHDLLRFAAGGAVHDVTVRYAGAGFVLELPGGVLRARGEPVARRGNALDLRADLAGAQGEATLVWQGPARQGEALTLFADGDSWPLVLVDPGGRGEDDDVAPPHLAAPMPGRVVQVLVAAGARVTRGQPLLLLEAMKMEHAVKAPADGIVTALRYQAGDLVEEGAELCDFEAAVAPDGKS